MNDIFDSKYNELLAEIEAEMVLPTGNPGWGSDLSCTEDITAEFDELAEDDPRAVAEYTYRRLITNPGELADEADWGCGLPRMLNSGYTTQQIKTIQDALRGEIARDDRLQNVTVSATYSPQTELLSITIDAEIVDSDNTFSLVTYSTSGATNLIEMVVNGQVIANDLTATAA